MDTSNLDLETLCIYGDMAFEAKKWSHELTSQNIDYVEKENHINIVGCSTFLKIILFYGQCHQVVSFKECRSELMAEAFEGARNGSFLKALYNALFTFGQFRKVMEDLLTKKLERLNKQQQQSLVWEKNNKD